MRIKKQIEIDLLGVSVHELFAKCFQVISAERSVFELVEEDLWEIIRHAAGGDAKRDRGDRVCVATELDGAAKDFGEGRAVREKIENGVNCVGRWIFYRTAPTFVDLHAMQQR